MIPPRYSLGIGVTPVLAMLHALAAETSTREVWWLHGARNGREHAFAAEVRGLLAGLAHHHSHVCYSAPDPGDRLDVDFDSIRTSGPPGASNRRRPTRRRFLSVRAGTVHDRSLARACRIRCRTGSRSHRDVWRRTIPDTRHSGLPAEAGALAGRRNRPGSDGLVRPQRPQCLLGTIICQPARTGRSLRRSRALVVPDRRVPQLRERAGGRRGQLCAGSARRTSGRQCPDLLFTAPGRRRHRSVSVGTHARHARRYGRAQCDLT